MKFFKLLFACMVMLFVMNSCALAKPLTLPEPKGVYSRHVEC
jgi:hypothetical protein